MRPLLFVLGADPETAHLASVARAARARGLPVRLAAAGPKAAEADHHIAVPEDLEPAVRTARLLEALDAVLEAEPGCAVVVAGEGEGAVAGALAARQRGCLLACVGAGLRSPGGHHRVAVDHLSDLLLCATERQAEQLLREGIPSARVLVVGSAEHRAPEAVVQALQDLCAQDLPGEEASAAPPAARRLPSDADASGRELGEEELELLRRVVRSGTLHSTRGTFVSRFEREFAALHGVPFAVACSSGTAAVHAALAALDLRAGDEVVTSPVTDMGAIMPVFYQGAVPVFADVDPRTLLVTARTLRDRLTSRTRAVVVTHLFGRPCAMDPVLELAREAGIAVIEDAAQAFLAEDAGRKAGTMGQIGCFSLQQTKHMTAGEGGIVLAADETLARRVRLFVNKGWPYGEPEPDHLLPALNSRMTELQGAVAVAQLARLPGVVSRRREAARRLSELLAGVPGLALPQERPGSRASWWRFPLLVDPAVVEGGAVGLGGRLADAGVACAPRYTGRLAFECAVLRDPSAFAVTALPFAHEARRGAPPPPWSREACPGAAQGIERVLVLPVNERWTEEDLRFVAGAVHGAVEECIRLAR